MRARGGGGGHLNQRRLLPERRGTPRYLQWPKWRSSAALEYMAVDAMLSTQSVIEAIMGDEAPSMQAGDEPETILLPGCARGARRRAGSM